MPGNAAGVVFSSGVCRETGRRACAALAFLAFLRNARRGTAAGPSGITTSLRAYCSTMKLTARSCMVLPSGLCVQMCRRRLSLPSELAVQSPSASPRRRRRAAPPGRTHSRAGVRVRAPSRLHAVSVWPQHPRRPGGAGPSPSSPTRCHSDDPRATVLSTEAVGAFDQVSRHAMLVGLMHRPSLQLLLPFVRPFYADFMLPTPCLSCICGRTLRATLTRFGRPREASKVTRSCPLSTLFDAKAQHPALAAANAQLREGEAVFASVTTSILLRPLGESVSCRTFANEHSASTRASSSIAAGPASGMSQVRNLSASMLDLCGESEDPIWTGDWPVRGAARRL